MRRSNGWPALPGRPGREIFKLQQRRRRHPHSLSVASTPRAQPRPPARSAATYSAKDRHSAPASTAGQHCESDSEGARTLFHRAQQRRQQESAKASGRSHNARHDADAIRKSLRHQLKHRSVTHAQRTHCRSSRNNATNAGGSVATPASMSAAAHNSVNSIR